MAAPRLTAANSMLAVIDIQDKLLAKIPAASRLVRTTSFLLDAAKLVNVPVLCTEQYPKGLGPTTPEIAKRLTQPALVKTAFSCCGAVGFLQELRTSDRKLIVLVGMETHVCVLQTALDLLDAGFSVFLPADALESRNELDKTFGLSRLEKAGAVLTSAEAVGFEWLGDSTHPQFKSFSKIIQEMDQR